ncbi:MAG: N-acetylglutaminylglutamine amidotransferase [Xanthobacteraceae bacterium]|nr:N-acetylglutaminylglutamine amidotransferase [Xanthobacteraceae bacterium]
MCGICGEIRSRGDAASAAVTEAISGNLKHRGPDAGGVYAQRNVALGHRRLSILDLSPAADQPMIDAELGLAIAFNGCIYNFRDLRGELEAKGYRFFTGGDTEVILKSYHAWGARCVERFKGMFAFAIAERESGRVVFARDRLGIKPLYYTDNGGRFRFASTLTALLAAGGVDTSIDPVALHHYLSFHGAVPAPRTIFNGVKKLAPATLLTIEPGGARREEVYWRCPVQSQDRVMTEAEWAESVREHLRTAVERRRVADVPLGVLLSGGLDSSLLVALLAESGQKDLQTFSIGFENVNGLKGDEFAYSDLVAKKFGTKHHRIPIATSRAIPAMAGVVSQMSEPQVSHDAIGFYLLSEEVSQHVKVVQCGQGADEVFGGYHWYPHMLRSNDPVSDYMRVYCEHSHDEISDALEPSLAGADHSRALVENYFDRARSQRAIDKTLELDQQIMMIDDPVKRVDNMTMAFGLEARTPLLDHELVELAAKIPAELKIKNGGKHILKEAARGLVPDEIIGRKKGYFPVPALKFLRGPMLEFVRGVLSEPAAKTRGIFKREYVDRLLKNPERELTTKGNSKLWQAALLEYWLQVQTAQARGA